MLNEDRNEPSHKKWYFKSVLQSSKGILPDFLRMLNILLRLYAKAIKPKSADAEARPFFVMI